MIESEENANRGKRGHYEKFSPELRFEIGKRAAEKGVAAMMRFYAKKFVLKESSVQTWKNAYTQEIRSRRGEITALKSLPKKKRGRPYLLGEELDKQVRAYVTSLRCNSAVVNTAIVISCAEGMIKNHNSNLLASNGGHILLTKNWGESILRRMGFVKRGASTKAKVSIENFEEIKAQILLDIKAVVEMEDIPFDLIVNWDQTGIHYVPVGSWMMDKEGSK